MSPDHIKDTVDSPARIVVGVDGSAASIEALRWAARLAPTLDAEIDAISAWQYPPNYSMGVDYDAGSDAAQILAQALKEAFGDDKPATLRARVCQGHPAQVLIAVSTDIAAQMLIVGSRGHGGFAGLLLGATSAYCAEHATCPVLVVHNTPAPDSP